MKAPPRPAPAAVTLSVWAQPGANRERVVSRMGDALKMAVTAPPEKGKANQAIERFLARELGVPAASVAVVAGGASKRKLVRIVGVSADAVQSWMKSALGE